MQARRWTATGIVVVMLLVTAVVLAGLSGLVQIIPPVYRAHATLLLSRGPLAADPERPFDDGFFETQIALLTNWTVQARTRQRLKKTPLEVSELLLHLEAARVGRTHLIVVAAESNSREFAREFVNTLGDEYIRLLDEERARTAETALLQLTREINRLSQEINACDERIRAYAEEHGETAESAPRKLQELRADGERIRQHHDRLLDKLLEIDINSQFNLRQVTLLQPAMVERKPRRWWFW